MPTRFNRGTWSRTLPLLLGLACHGLASAASAALPIPINERPVLQIQGSNTVGAQLAPMLIAGLFEAQGLQDVHISDTEVENEQRISGRDESGRAVHAHVAAHGSGTGFSGLASGAADLAASSRPIKSGEHAALAKFGDLRSSEAEQVIAIDGLAVVIHPNNPIDALTVEQVAQLFAGDVQNWSQLGGPDLQVQLHARDSRSGTYDSFNELVLAAYDKELAGSARRYESNDQLASAVALNHGAIGFVGLASAGKAKPLAIGDGDSQPMLPTEALVATEDYPLSRRLFLYSLPDQQSLWTQALIKFAHSPAGQAIVSESGYIAQTIEAVSLAPQAQMPMSYQDLAREARRLTVNFRFDEGSGQLDNKGQRDIERLIEYLHSHDKAVGNAVLVGFGDSKTDPARAALLSKLRAMVVRRELATGGIYPKDISGMGDELPVASNDGAGRMKNRRVEVWVY